jgi:hypothetical protein
MSIRLKKILRTVSKVVLLLVGVGVVGYVGYLTYMSLSYKPREVRVSNITDSSFTVSWVTDSPMKGVVYYKEDDSFLPGPLAWVGGSKAVDDRDFALAQSRCVQEFNEEASEVVDEDFIVSAENFDCEDISVTDYGEYYTHHVTLKNLDSEKAYYFRAGDTFFYWEGEIKGSETFTQLEEVKEPTPIFGKITNEEGVYTDDSIIYATFENGREGKNSILYSSVTNEQGGWYLDGSYIRTEEGELVGMESGQDLFKANAQYMNYGLSGTYEWLFGYFGGNYPDIVVGNRVLENSFLGNFVLSAFAGDSCTSCPSWMTDEQIEAIREGSASDDLIKQVGYGNAAKALADQNLGVITGQDVEKLGLADNAGNVSALMGEGIKQADYDNKKKVAKDNNTKVEINLSAKTVTAPAAEDEGGDGDADEEEETGVEAPPQIEYENQYTIDVKKDEDHKATVGAIEINVQDYIPDIEKSCKGATGSNCKVCIGEGSDLEGCHVVVDPVDIEFTAFVSYLTTEIKEKVDDETGSTTTDELGKYNVELAKLEPLAGEYLENIKDGVKFTYQGENDDAAATEYPLKQNDEGEFYFEINDQEILLSDIQDRCGDNSIKNCDETELNKLKDLDTFRENVKNVSDFAVLASDKVQESMLENEGYDESGICLDDSCPCPVQGDSVEKGQSLNDCPDYSSEDEESGSLELPEDEKGKNNIEIQLDQVCGLAKCTCYYEYLEGSDQNPWQVVSKGEECPPGEPLLERVEEEGPTEDLIILEPLSDNVELVELETSEGQIEGVPCPEASCVCGEGTVSRGYVCTPGMKVTNSDENKHTFRKESGLCTDPDGCECYSSAGVNLRRKSRKLQKNIDFGDYCFAGIDPKDYKALAEQLTPEDDSNYYIDYGEYCEYPGGCDCAGSHEVDETKLCVKPETETSILGEQDNLRVLSNLLETLLYSTLRVNQAFANSEDDYTYFLPEYGFYDMEVEGLAEIENVPALEKGEHRLFYVEANGIDGFQMPKDPDDPQPGEDILLRSNALRIRYKTTASSQLLELRKGNNIISFDYIPKIGKEESTKASDLLRYLQEKGYVVGFMSYFDGGRWKGVLVDQDGISGTDFSLLPGRGYLIRSLSDISIQVPVYEIRDSIPIPLSAGWNLVGVHGYSRAYTAGSLIDSINLIEGLTADNVSWWPVSKGRYEGLQITDGTEYGFDFPITTTNGYFVRINEFEPEDQACRSIIWHDRGDLHGTCGHSRSVF